MTSFVSNRGNGLIMNAMVKVFWNMELAKSMKESGKTTNCVSLSFGIYETVIGNGMRDHAQYLVVRLSTSSVTLHHFSNLCEHLPNKFASQIQNARHSFTSRCLYFLVCMS